MVGESPILYGIRGSISQYIVTKLDTDYNVLAEYFVKFQHGSWTCTCEARTDHCKHRDMAQSMLNDSRWPPRIAAGYKRDSKNKRWIAPAILANEME